MPANMVKSVQDKCGMSKDEAEKKWKEAKQKASDEGHSEDWPYVVEIFKHLVGKECANKMKWDLSKKTNEGIQHIIEKYL